jgi:hypothetical protein
MNPVGFLISSDREEFLLDYSINSGHIKRVWSPILSTAKVFDTRLQAQTVLIKLNCSYRLWVLQLLETDEHFIVTTGSSIRPKWLHG